MEIPMHRDAPRNATTSPLLSNCSMAGRSCTTGGCCSKRDVRGWQAVNNREGDNSNDNSSWYCRKQTTAWQWWAPLHPACYQAHTCTAAAPT